MPEPRLDARKSLGQHFLRDRGALADIVARCREGAPGLIIEIGPGPGALTEHLVTAAPRVILIEKDRRFVELHRERYADAPHVTVLEADATEVDYAALAAGETRAVAAGNLPYNVAAPIYFRLLLARHAFARFVLMFQREVAERFVAAPGTDAYGAPSVSTAFFTEARITRRLPPEAFSPKPKVHSAVLLADIRPAPLHPVEDEPRFLAFVRDVFRFRRKTLANALEHAGAAPDKGGAALATAAGCDPKVRGEMLDASAFWRLYVASGGR